MLPLLTATFVVVIVLYHLLPYDTILSLYLSYLASSSLPIAAVVDCLVMTLTVVLIRMAITRHDCTYFVDVTL